MIQKCLEYMANTSLNRGYITPVLEKTFQGVTEEKEKSFSCAPRVRPYLLFDKEEGVQIYYDD